MTKEALQTETWPICPPKTSSRRQMMAWSEGKPLWLLGWLSSWATAELIRAKGGTFPVRSDGQMELLSDRQWMLGTPLDGDIKNHHCLIWVWLLLMTRHVNQMMVLTGVHIAKNLAKKSWIMIHVAFQIYPLQQSKAWWYECWIIQLLYSISVPAYAVYSLLWCLPCALSCTR